MNIIAFTSIKGGELTMKNKKQFLADVKVQKDGDYILELRRQSKKRSIRQNAFLHGVVIPICRQGFNNIGYKVTNEQAKVILKNLFLKGTFINEETGEFIEYVKDTKDLTTVEMLEFIATVQQYAAETLGVYVPDPNEYITN